MARIGNFSEVENHERRPVSGKINEKEVSVEDKRKLETGSGDKDKYRIANARFANDGKEKLNATCSERRATEKKPPEDLETNLKNYFNDLKKRSDCPDTINEQPFHSRDLKKVSAEETSVKRDEFDDKKADLKKQWASEHNRSWPKYDKDVYSANGKLIRKAGGDYDAHHIQPLGMGGKNEVSNITPLHANEHYDKQGVHSPSSPYSKLDKML